MADGTPTPPPGGFGPDAGSGPHGSGTPTPAGTPQPDVYSRYLQGKATDADLQALVDNGDITLTQAESYAQKRQDALTPLVNDLAGLVPVDLNTGEIGYPAESPIGRTSVEAGHAIRTYADPQTGVLYDVNGKMLPQNMQKFLNGGGGGTSPETIRQNRISEAMKALDVQTIRQRAALAGAQFTAPTDTNGFFPQFQPTSPLVRSGLADPMKFTLVPYGSNVGGDQAASDLAMIRRLAGVR